MVLAMRAVQDYHQSRIRYASPTPPSESGIGRGAQRRAKAMVEIRNPFGSPAPLQTRKEALGRAIPRSAVSPVEAVRVRTVPPATPGGKHEDDPLGGVGTGLCGPAGAQGEKADLPVTGSASDAIRRRPEADVPGTDDQEGTGTARRGR